MREIAEALDVDQSTSSRTLNPLVELELATRETDPDDRRNTVVRVTPLGRRTAEQISERRMALMRSELLRMPRSHRLLLTEMLEEYVTILDRDDD